MACSFSESCINVNNISGEPSQQINTTCKEVSHSQVAQQVIDWEMEAAVFENGAYDQKIGEDDDEADGHAQADDHVITPPPVVTDVLPAGLIEKLDRAVVVASLCVLLQRVHVGL